VRYVVGCVDILLGAGFLLGAGLAAQGLPNALERYAAEPEDLILLVVLAVLGLAVGGISIVGGFALLRSQIIGGLSEAAVAWGLAGSSLLLAAISALGFWSGDASSVELRLLALPSVLLVASAALVRRRVES